MGVTAVPSLDVHMPAVLVPYAKGTPTKRGGTHCSSTTENTAQYADVLLITAFPFGDAYNIFPLAFRLVLEV